MENLVALPEKRSQFSQSLSFIPLSADLPKFKKNILNKVTHIYTVVRGTYTTADSMNYFLKGQCYQICMYVS